MNTADYEKQGAQAYANGRIIFPGARQSSWQRAAFVRGYMKARGDWRAANPGADEWDAAAKRAAELCKRMTGNV